MNKKSNNFIAVILYPFFFCSPEICENKPYNNKSDIWALGKAKELNVNQQLVKNNIDITIFG